MGEYILAIDDCLKCSSLSEEDEEVTLLLTFYYYLDGQYEECYQQLGKVVADSEEARFKEFQQALNLRLSNNAEAGMVGQLIASLEEEELGLQEDYL